MEKHSVYPGVDDDRMNKKHQSTLGAYKDTMKSDGEDVKDQPHGHPGSTGNKSDGPMHTKLMNWTEIRESLDEISSAIDQQEDDMMSDSIPADTGDISRDGDKKSLINELNQIFTPILVMQGFEGDTVAKIQEAMSEASVLTEQNIIRFDDETRMAQLISVCALLIEKQKGTDRFKTYQQAATIRNQTKLEIQKDNYEEARALAQEYLNFVTTNNNSSVARNAAQGLLPQTQH